MGVVSSIPSALLQVITSRGHLKIWLSLLFCFNFGVTILLLTDVYSELRGISRSSREQRDLYSQQLIDLFRVRPTRDGCFLSQLPRLDRIRLFSPSAPTNATTATKTDFALPEMFEPAMSMGQKRLYKRLLKLFSDIMFDNGMGDRFMLTGGTLLGSFRHHDLIPWDDDIDILVDVAVRFQVRELLRRLQPTYHLRTFRSTDKFFAHPDSNSTRRILGRKWGWPFLDISYYSLNRTHLNELTWSYAGYYSWPLHVIFPLYFRPFGQAWYPAPRDPITFLKMTYSSSQQCEMLFYSHVLEKRRPSQSVRCEQLAYRYPFVEHRLCQTSDGVHTSGEMQLTEERLVLRVNVSKSVVIHSICLAADVKNTKALTYELDHEPMASESNI